MRRIALACTVVALALAPRSTHAAGSTMLGGFQPVAVEDGARAAWICPAEIASRSNPQLLIEGLFREDADGSFGKISSVTLAASAPGSAYGWQLEFDDVTGVPDWTLVAAHVIGHSRGPRLGSAVEYRGGEKNKFDAILGAFAPIGRNLRAAVAVEDLFRADIDGVPAQRSWRGGLAARGDHGYVSWDWRGLEYERARNVFGAGFDVKWIDLSGAVDTDGGWSAAARLVVRNRRGGGGVTDPDEGGGSRFATVEMGS